MRKLLLILAVVLLVAGAVWYLTGGVQKVTESRVEAALTEKGVPPVLAACMAQRMASELTIGQLRALERLAPDPGEAAIPRLPGEALARLRRVDDPEAIRITTRAGLSCALQNLR